MTDIKEIQNCCLNILRDIDRVCREFDIHYSLCGGSVIGYHLYKGFIPWDDDIDLMMTRENYDRFLKVYPLHCAPAYRLLHYSLVEEQVLPTLFSRVEDVNTQITEEIAGKIRQGHIFVDVTVFDTLRSRLDLMVTRAKVSFIYSFLYKNNGMTPGTGWKRSLYRLVPKVTDQKKLRKIYEVAEAICRKKSQNPQKKRYCAELLSAAYGGILYEKRLFRSYQEVEFSGVKTSLIVDYYDYLFVRYQKHHFEKKLEDSEIKTHVVE